MKTALNLLLFINISISAFNQPVPEPPFRRFPTLPPLKLLLTDSTTQFTEKDLPKNKAVFVILFSPDCDHCQKETEELIEMIDSFKNIQIVMTTILPFDKMKEFYTKYQLQRFSNIIVGHDYQHILPTFYRIKNMPYLAFYNKKGNLIEGIEGALPLNKVLEYFRE